MRLQIVSAAVLAMGVAAAAVAEDQTAVQRRSMTQETQYNGSSNASGSVQAPAAGVNAPTIASSPTYNNGIAPVSQRTTTTEETVMAQNNPPIRWSILEGEVTHVDKVNNVVEIRLSGSKNTIGVPVVEKRVGIYRHGDHQYALKDIEPGDNVTLRNLNTAAM